MNAKVMMCLFDSNPCCNPTTKREKMKQFVVVIEKLMMEALLLRKHQHCT